MAAAATGKQAPHPLLQYTYRGALTLLDAGDISLLRNQTLRPCTSTVRPPGETPEHFHKAFLKRVPAEDDIESRCEFKREEVLCELDLSLQDLQAFGSTKQELNQPGPCVLYPFSKDAPPGIVLMAALKFISTGEFPLPLYAGCTLKHDFLAARKDLLGKDADQELVLAQFARLGTSDQLLYQVSSEDGDKRTLLVERVKNLAVLDKDEEVRRLQQLAFLPEASLYRGCEELLMQPPAKAACPARTYWLVPEIHGLGQVIKQQQEQMFSHARVFAESTNGSGGGLFFHVPERAFQMAVKHVDEMQRSLAAPTDWQKIAVYVTHQPSPPVTLPHGLDATQKFRVSLCLDLFVMRPKLAPSDDVFLSSSGALGKWLGSLKYFDPLLATYEEPAAAANGEQPKAADKCMRVNAIHPQNMQEYLERHLQKRRDTKRGNGPRTDMTYVELLLEEL
jgi:hypothetical protein